MVDPTASRRDRSESFASGGAVDRALGSSFAFGITALTLVAIFSMTFFVHPQRAAPADDPAYYTWRTEALLENEPDAMLGIHGPFDMYASGYRVTTPVVAGVLRRVADVGPLTPTIVIGVALRVLIPLLLAGFAYRHRRDPLIWHAIAFATGGLLVTPPFAGYLDNMMTLLFLAASLYFVEGARSRWAARVVLFALLLMSGLTHPTTLAIYCVVLFGISVARFALDGFHIGASWRRDRAVLTTAMAAAVGTYLIWKVGIWGPTASLSEAALPPPAGPDFFRTRLGGWIRAMRPLWNGPLFVCGLVGLFSAGRKALKDDLTLVSVVWLAPLLGILGAFAGLTYPYYRFFNTTLAWLLVVGLGVFYTCRFLLARAARGGVQTLALLGLALIGFILASNFSSGLSEIGWNDPADAWIKPDQRADLDALSDYLGRSPQAHARPIVFIADDEAPEEVRIYGFAKLVGNVSRYAVPDGAQPDTSVYLGSLDNFLSHQATDRDAYYLALSEESLRDTDAVVGDSEPLIVVADVFNRTGRNALIFDAGGVSSVDSADDVVFLAGGEIYDSLGERLPRGVPEPDNNTVGDAFWVLLAAVVILTPGVWLTRVAMPDAESWEVAVVSPVVSTVAIGLLCVGLLAITGSPLTPVSAWTSIALFGGIAVVARGLQKTRTVRSDRRAG